MIRINLLPHREEKRKRRQQQFGVLGGISAVIGLLVAGAVWLFLDQQVMQQQQNVNYMKSEIAKLDKQIEEIRKIREETASLLAKKQVEVALAEGATAVAHGCTGKGNDQVRIDGTALALNPDIKIIAPIREWNMGRDEEIKYAKEHGIPVSHTKDKPYSYDENMWGISGEGGEVENPALVPPLEKILILNNTPEKAPDVPETIHLDFVKGLPVSLNGKQMKLADLIMKLNKIGAKHGVGTNIHIEDRVVGLKIRDIFESPAADIIIAAHEKLEYYVSTKEENSFKRIIDKKWADLCYGGLWYEPLMADLNAYMDSVNEWVTGTITMRLYKGKASAVARSRTRRR